MDNYEYDYVDQYTDSGIQDVIYEERSDVFSEVLTKSFIFMFAALIITAIGAFTTSPMAAYKLLSSGAFPVVIVVELVVVLLSNWAIRKNNAVLAGVFYTIYSYVTGFICSIIFMAYSMRTIGMTFIVCAGMFGAMAVIGLLTKKNLNSLGSYLGMALIGLILASACNILFIGSFGFDFIVTIVGILVFVGLTAYDAQKIKERAMYVDENSVLSLALFNGFQLYLDFINLFLRLLSILGGSKGRRK